MELSNLVIITCLQQIISDVNLYNIVCLNIYIYIYIYIYNKSLLSKWSIAVHCTDCVI